MSTEINWPVARQGAAYNVVTHFILGPVFIITFAVAIGWAEHEPMHRVLHWWVVVVAFALILLTMQERTYSLRVQDRVIRLEERPRLMTLAPGVYASELSLRQLSALRFASDAELPACRLVECPLGGDPGIFNTWRARIQVSDMTTLRTSVAKRVPEDRSLS